MTYVMPIIAYLIGSISSAIIVCKVMGLPDPRTQGSGNPGATNVLRSGGKKAAAVTLLGDAFKGLLPVLLATYAGAGPVVIGATTAAAVVGHMFPVFFQFRGGKGVATAFGVAFGVNWVAGLLAVATWLAVALTFRYSSLAALTALALLPLFFWITAKSSALVIAAGLIAILVFWRHGDNIRRLLAGEESRIGKKT